MPVHVSLLDAIATGQFGPIRFGMTKEEVRATLGIPDDKLVPRRRQRQSPGWVYGDIEIYFEPPEWTVIGVFADDFDVLDGGTGFEIDSGGLQGGISWNELIKILRDRGVAFSEVSSPDASARWLRTGSGVTLTVVTEPEKFDPKAGLFALWWEGGLETRSRV